MGNEPTTDASLVETHISVVVFVGDRVHKLKKPVRFPFIDLSTRAARERICHREVELNSRLAPDVYLGVADITDPQGDLCDHLVVMRRLASQRRLSTLVEHRQGDAEVEPHLVDLAELLAAFHRRAERSADIDAAGHADAIKRRWEQLFDEVEPSVGPVLDASTVTAVRDLSERFLEVRAPLLDLRIGQGAICDGHGDLQADDVFCLDDGPRVLDCVEFDDELRYCDYVNDVAFLVMDLERLGAPGLSERFVDAYEAASGEVLPRVLLHFYVAYRALVRCMVSCLRVSQSTGEEREQAAGRARELLTLAHSHLRATVPRVAMVGGLPGTGKSTVAGSLVDSPGRVLIRSDLIRKEQAGLSATDRTGADYGQGIYGHEATESVYVEMARRARRAVELGSDVVLDASFQAESHREQMRAMARGLHAEVIEVRCVLDEATATTRIEERAARGDDASDATASIAHKMASTFDPWPEAEEISTATAPEESADRARSVVFGSPLPET